MSITGWMLEFESESEDKTTIWNDGGQALDDKANESRIVEQTTRLMAVHPADQRCGLCPVPTSDPQEPGPDPNEGKGDEEPQPKKAGDDLKDE
jgi:hypothetical protein